MTRVGRDVAGAGWLALSLYVSLGMAECEGEKDVHSFGFSRPVVCKEINGYEDYEPLPEASLTSDEKLLVYFVPRHYKTSHEAGRYEAHFTQDGRIRRRGGKSVVWSKDKLLNYRPRSENALRPIYLRNTISVKGLKPGEYEFEIILRDEIGQSPPASGKVPFRITPSKPSFERPEK
ncbi:MAG: hypothetical protein NVSMB9_11000 [Isosphaeraceae bacterium]